MKPLFCLLLSALLLAGCSRQGAIFQEDPFSPPSDIPAGDAERGRENLRTAADALEELGIDGAREAGDALLEWMEDSETGEWMLSCALATPEAAALQLLSDLGCGTWDEETWAWSPSSSQVYWLDFEAFNLDTMYTEVVQGIDVITGEDVVFADIAEDTSKVDYEKDAGTQGIGFLCNGEPCRYEADFNGDWIDPDFLTWMGQTLEGAKSGKRLYLCGDQGQGCILLWQTPEWVRALKKATGLTLEPAADSGALSPLDLLLDGTVL